MAGGSFGRRSGPVRQGVCRGRPEEVPFLIGVRPIGPVGTRCRRGCGSPISLWRSGASGPVTDDPKWFSDKGVYGRRGTEGKGNGVHSGLVVGEDDTVSFDLVGSRARTSCPPPHSTSDFPTPGDLSFQTRLPPPTPFVLRSCSDPSPPPSFLPTSFQFRSFLTTLVSLENPS